MRLDHIAFRVRHKDTAIKFLTENLFYKAACPFELVFDDGSTCECMAMEPPEKLNPSHYVHHDDLWEYHLAPEIFVSEGGKNSIVSDWVVQRNGLGGIHHIAYQVFHIDQLVKDWKANGVQFSSDIIDCPEDDLRQVFTKPIAALGGLIIELIERGDKGFCKNSVKNLMESTKDE